VRMATASMQNRGPPRQTQQPGTASSSSGQPPTSARIKTPSSSGSPGPQHHHHHHHTRETSNDQQKYPPLLSPDHRSLGLSANLALRRPTWGRKNSSAGSGTGGPANLGNRANTPTSSHSRTNSPTPPVATTTNAWTQKADERAAAQAHEQFTHLLFTLTVHNPPYTPPKKEKGTESVHFRT
jgi:hypothetical protein